MGVQNEPPHDVPRWYWDYSELKAILALGSGEISALTLNYLEEFELKALLIIRDYQEIISFESSLGQGKLLLTTCLFFLPSCNDPRGPQPSLAHPSPGCLTYLNPPPYLRTSPACGASDSHAYEVPMCAILKLIFSWQSASCWFDYSASHRNQRRKRGFFPRPTLLKYPTSLFYHCLNLCLLLWFTCLQRTYGNRSFYIFCFFLKTDCLFPRASRGALGACRFPTGNPWQEPRGLTSRPCASGDSLRMGALHCTSFYFFFQLLGTWIFVMSLYWY